VSLRVAFRVDASPKIGIGHVMRCLTLADAIAARGGSCRFVSRHLPSHMRRIVEGCGHEAVATAGTPGPVDELAHADWLETSQAADAADTIRALDGSRWDVLVIDHYALDGRWEQALRAVAARVAVIDDLADRAHDCDLLLDQNVYPSMHTRYDGLVPAGCALLIGPDYALVRPDFRLWRERVAPRDGRVRRVMVCFGGVDAGDLTGAALESLGRVDLSGRYVDVVVGASHPRLAAVQEACASAGYECHVQSDRMAELMAAADLAFGAAGSTSWERCAVGLPTLCAATAHNQVAIAQGLEAAGVSVTVGDDGGEAAGAFTAALAPLLEEPQRLARMSRAAWDLVDGLGAGRVCDRILEVA
jgi:UDP-2,4-diacetamido-2,4,6-trideoxy-beta-L-altropyranose hydrolase